MYNAPVTVKLRIGKVQVDPPLILAPMAGVTNRALRLMCREAGGCGLVSTEMVSAYALWFKHRRTHEMLDWGDDEHPVSAQIFGAAPDVVAEAARIVEAAGADIVDLNFGCPAPKVAKTGAGGALLKDLSRVKEIITDVVGAVGIPVTVKTRKGWDEAHEKAVELAKIAEDCGAAAVTVHGRTVAQGYSGKADWDAIRRAKEAVGIPVIGNGDVRSGWDARRMFDETGCDGVMIGRGALGDPWIFGRVHAFLETGDVIPEPDFLKRIEGARRQALLLAECLGEERAAKEMRGHIAWYLKGVPGAAATRAKVMATKSLTEVEEVLNEARSQCKSGVSQGR